MKRSSSILKPTNTWNGSTAKIPASGTIPPDWQGSAACLAAYGSRELSFRFRGREFCFVLSHGLFSSAGIDRGTRLLLKVFSRLLDEDLAGGRPLPRRVLDSGCGTGVIGVCAAGALAETAGRPEDESGPLLVRCQDRDDLARLFTLGNAARNGLGPALLEARTEPLLAGAETWDLILSNVPAKAGEPVLEDFISRSAALLVPGGRALVVVVNSLAGFFRAHLNGARGGPSLIGEEAGTEHRVFVYGGPASAPPDIPALWGPAEELPGPRSGFWWSVYRRGRAAFEIEGVHYEICSVHGAAEFDRPSGAVETAAALVRRLGAAALFQGGPVLVHEGGQGHFPLWFLHFLEWAGAAPPEFLLLHGRNVLALEAARSNIAESSLTGKPRVLTVPGPDLVLDRDSLGAALAAGKAAGSGQGAGFIAVFPQPVPRTDPYPGIWEALGTLLRPGAAALLALSATEAERFDKRRLPGFTHQGDLKRRGFRALVYRRR